MNGHPHLDLRLLGPMEVLADGVPLDVGPASASGTLQAYISQLRRILEQARAPRTQPSVVLTRAPGTG